MLFVFILKIYCCPTRFPYLMMFVSFNSNTMSVTSGAGTTSPSRVAEVYVAICVAQSLVFCVVFYRSSFVLFVLFIFATVLSVLRFTDSDDLFDNLYLFFVLMGIQLFVLLKNVSSELNRYVIHKELQNTDIFVFFVYHLFAFNSVLYKIC
jgi:hypothetical protein